MLKVFLQLHNNVRLVLNFLQVKKLELFFVLNIGIFLHCVADHSSFLFHLLLALEEFIHFLELVFFFLSELGILVSRVLHFLKHPKSQST